MCVCVCVCGGSGGFRSVSDFPSPSSHCDSITPVTRAICHVCSVVPRDQRELNKRPAVGRQSQGEPLTEYKGSVGGRGVFHQHSRQGEEVLFKETAASVEVCSGSV